MKSNLSNKPLLRLALWVKFSADDILKYFSYIPQKARVDISCKLSPVETIHMKCQILFSGKNKKKNHQFVVSWFSQESEKG